MSGSTRTISNDSAVYNRGSKVFKSVALLEIAAADLATTGDVVPICELPPEAIVTSIKHLNDDLDSNGSPALAADIGIYKTTKAGVSLKDNPAGTASEIVAESAYSVLDADIYVDGMTTLQGAVTTLTEILGSGTNAVDLDNRYKTVRELVSVDVGEDPSKYFLGLKCTVNAATAAAGGAYFEVEWIQG